MTTASRRRGTPSMPSMRPHQVQDFASRVHGTSTARAHQTMGAWPFLCVRGRPPLSMRVPGRYWSAIFAIAGGLDGAFNDSLYSRCRRRHRVLSSDRKELRTQTVFAMFSGVAALRPMGLIFPKNLAPRKRLPGPWWDAAAEVGPSPFRAPWMAVSRCMGAYTPVAAPRLVVDPSWAATIYGARAAGCSVSATRHALVSNPASRRRFSTRCLEEPRHRKTPPPRAT